MNQNLNIVFNTWNGAFFYPGGGEVQLLQSKKYLELLGHKIMLYNPWNPQKDCDLLHQFSIQAGVEQVISGYKKIGKPVALSTIFWAEIEKSNPFFQPILNIFNMCDLLLTNSVSESNKLSQIFDIDINKFHETRNSITNDYLNLETDVNFKKKYSLPEEFILIVANIEPRKNIHSLIMAAQKLNIPIVSIGHIKDEDYFNKFIKDRTHVIHLGPILNVSTLKSAYQQCSLFVLPSICETPGIAALEAASQGSKVVITKDGSTQDYFLNFVEYVNPFSVENIEVSIEKVLNLKNDFRLRQHILENYTWDKTASDIVNGYQRILS